MRLKDFSSNKFRQTFNKMKSSTISTYNKFHEVYDQETVEFWDNFPKDTIKEFVSRLNGKKILDLGSGPGRDAMLLKAEELEVICLDASSEMVKRTKDLGFESVLADMRKLDFPEKSFDGVWAFTSLLHISKDEASKVISKIYKLLKPNGVFLVGMIEGEFEGDVEQESMPGAKRYFRFYSERELRELMEGKGFKFEYQGKYTPHSKTYLNQVYSVAS